MSFNKRITERIPKSSDIPELLPCPFCNSVIDRVMLASNGEVFIKCPRCGIESPRSISSTIVVGKWNRRSRETLMQTEIDGITSKLLDLQRENVELRRRLKED